MKERLRRVKESSLPRTFKGLLVIGPLIIVAVIIANVTGYLITSKVAIVLIASVLLNFLQFLTIAACSMIIDTEELEKCRIELDEENINE